MIDRLNEWCGRTIAWLTLAMVVVTFTVVVLRYAFNLGWVAMQETVTWMHAVVLMLGAAYTLKHDAHVRVDVFYAGFGERGRAWVDLAGTLLLLMPVALFIVHSAWDYVLDSWRVLERSREAGGLPGLFVLKTVIPAAGALLALQGVAVTLRCLHILGHRHSQNGSHGGR